MNIQIDTKNKTIIVKEMINLQKLVEELKKVNIPFEEYNIIPEVQWNYYYPYSPTIPYIGDDMIKQPIGPIFTTAKSNTNAD